MGTPLDERYPPTKEDIEIIQKILILSQQKSIFNPTREVIKNYVFEGKNANIFCGKNINKIEFNNCQFKDSHFSYSNITDCSFYNCVLIDSDFSNSKISGTSIRHSNIKESNFQGTVIQYTIFDDVKADCINFQNSQILNSNIDNSNFTSAGFSNNKLTSVRFHTTDLSNAKFDHTTFEDSDFKYSILINVDFSGSTGLLDPTSYLFKSFEWFDDDEVDAIIGYKIFNPFTEDCENMKTPRIITEEVNYDRTLTHASGITLYNKQGIIEKLKNESLKYIYQCIIYSDWFAGIVVPYDPGIGCIRTCRTLLLSKVDESDFFK